MNEIFHNNKYTRWYTAITTRARSRGVLREQGYEIHHIIPRSMGGTNDLSNLTKLTCREHYVCHRLLVRMCKTLANKKSMAWALHLMIHSNNPHQDRYLPKSRVYELIRRDFVQAQKDAPYVRTAEHAANVTAANKRRAGRKATAETRAKMSEARMGRESPNKGKPMSEEAKAKMRATFALKRQALDAAKALLPPPAPKIRKKPVRGPVSEETRRKISEALKTRNKDSNKTTTLTG